MSQPAKKASNISQPASNPYIDEHLMDAYMAYSPSENAKYLKQHAASKNTESIAATRAKTANTHQPLFTQYPPPQPQESPPRPPQTPTQFHANSQSELIDEEVTFYPHPIADGIGDEIPLLYNDLTNLKEGDILYILDEDSMMGWSRVTFIGLEEDGFRVCTNIIIPDQNEKFEEIFYNTFGDEDMPVIYAENKQTNNAQIKSENKHEIDFILRDFDYKIGGKLFVYDDANNFIFYRIEAYDVNSTKATLKDNSGIVSSLYLKNFKHENADTQSKAIAIVNDKDENEKESKKCEEKGRKMERIGQYVDINEIGGEFVWLKRTNGMKLKWISYKNTLLGTIVVATKHLYPISLDYKSLNFMSGIGLGFNWMDIDDEDDMNVIEEHLTLFLCDSQLDSQLNQIGKYSHYKFERHTISEILYDETNAIRRLMELEQNIIAKLNKNICSITNDEYGHLALIVGYVQKTNININSKPTMYYFKVKKFGVYKEENKQEIEKQEYIAVDLYNQKIVITMQPPDKDKKFSFGHTFNPSTLYEITSDLITNYCIKFSLTEEIDLFGRAALFQMSVEMDKAKQQETVSAKLGKETIFALIRLFDSRKTMIDCIDYISGKIKNAFQSQTGSDNEWKFTKEYDISPQLQNIGNSLKQETNAIRRQQKIFEKYIYAYDGKPLVNIAWETYDRAGIKGAIDEIISEEDKIFDNLKVLKEKLSKYLNR